jgi:protein SCO1/2
MFNGFLMKTRARFFIIVHFWILPSIIFGQITLDNVPELQKIDVIEHLGESIPLDLDFINDEGKTVSLGDYFNQGKPVLLTLAYYRCPMLCGLVLNGLTKGVTKLDYLPGEQFQMITISINPEESYRLAAAKKKTHLEALNKPVKKSSWIFLTDSTGNTKKIADALGFKYYYVEDRDEYAHPAVSFVLTEDGKISRYLYGIEYKESDLRLSLLEASEGEIGTTLDRIILYCFHYDPDAGGYVVFAGNLMRIGGVITLLIIGSVLGILWRKEFLKRRIIKTS